MFDSNSFLEEQLTLVILSSQRSSMSINFCQSFQSSARLSFNNYENIRIIAYEQLVLLYEQEHFHYLSLQQRRTSLKEVMYQSKAEILKNAYSDISCI